MEHDGRCRCRNPFHSLPLWTLVYRTGQKMSDKRKLRGLQCAKCRTLLLEGQNEYCSDKCFDDRYYDLAI